MSEIVYLSLGSNLGDREEYLRLATERLANMMGMTLLAESSVYHSVPVDCDVECPDFLNKVLKMECTLKPVQLLDNTEQLETSLGRTKKGFSTNRVIDIDIILFGDRIFDNERLEIPHPRMSGRHFVLIPLCEIAPDVIDPRNSNRFVDLIEALGDQGVSALKETAGE
ncbi:MAG: 2-amino-4-hydroxy-6-hydroxymethyldihydropteridine diphosphokinase [candidate division Zixibacteria bacterium]|nr:2-amino-4-hydroxy-6-hydroxymethyldihydropteridine diphosphokinase [candidate division Zixibacteria bacterium]